MEVLYRTGHKEEKMTPTSGSFLIAPPAMIDSRFSKTVLLVTHNNLAGTFALCINKPTNHDISQIAIELGIPNSLKFPLFWGGPVNRGSIWMLHSSEWKCQYTMPVNDSWSVTSNEVMFHHLSDGDVPNYFRIAYGICTWAPGQLDMELSGTPPFTRSSSWLIANDINPEDIFEQHIDEVWDNCIKTSGSQAVDNWL